jgi:large repetitive protein
MGPRASCRISLTLNDVVGANVTCSTDVDTSLSLVPPTLVINGGNQQFTCNAGGSNQYVELGASATDACGRSIDVVTGPPADTRRKGTQTVTYDVVDVFGNAAARQTRTVVVEEGPVRLENVPGDLVAECAAVGGISRSAPVITSYLNTPEAVDDCDPDETVVNDAPAFLPLGSTLVTWTVHDNGPTGVTASASITVRDTTAPSINCQPLTVPADGSGNAVVPDFRTQLEISDACTAASDLTIVQTPAPGTVLPLGQHEVTVTASDTASPPNTATCTTTLEVTAVAGDDPGGPGGCGAPACGGNAMLSLTAIWLGLVGLKLRRRTGWQARL